MPIRFVVAALLAAILNPIAKADDAKDVFGLTKVHEFHLELTAKEWERMQKVFKPPLFGSSKPPVEKPGEDPLERHKTAGFGIQFPWAHANLHTGGKIYKDVALRYKGNGSYATNDAVLKRNLKIELDHYDEDLRFNGLKTITLNAGAVDKSRHREALAYAIFRAAGVPAPRTAFAKVTLTVPGKFDKEFVGLYTFVEHVDKSFLKDHFQNAKGLLMKPERLRGIEYLGDDWSKYKDRYRPKHDPTDKQAQRVIDFAKLVNKGDDDTFKKEIGSYLDVDLFLRFVAVNTMLPNTDSFFTTGHNYFIYLNPKTDRFVFMPWDLDLAFAGFPAMGSIDQQATQNLMRPHSGKLKLVDRLLADPEINAKYQKVLKEIAEKTFTRKKLVADLDAMEKVTKEPLAMEARAIEKRKEKADAFTVMVSGWFAPAELRSFIERRAAAVAAQVADQNKK